MEPKQKQHPAVDMTGDGKSDAVRAILQRSLER